MSRRWVILASCCCGSTALKNRLPASSTPSRSPLLAERGARVIVEVQPPLVALAATAEGVAQVTAAGAALPDFEVHCPLVSLAERFATRLDTIPAAVPYLFADPEAAARWRAKLGDAPAPTAALLSPRTAVHPTHPPPSPP